MEYTCTSARFHFFNGRDEYTVEFQYALMTWYIFPNKDQTGAIFNKKIDPKKSQSPTRVEAESILLEYLCIHNG